MRKRPRELPAPAAAPNPYLRAASILLCLGIIAVSTAISRGTVDTFRLPKEIVCRAEAILLIALGVFAATERRGRWRDLIGGIPRAELALCGAILLWTLVTTAVSTNRLLSVQSTITVVATIVLYLATRRLVPQMSWLLLDVCFAAAVVNAIFIVLQEYGVWNPFTFPPSTLGHLRSTALIGNPDDVGAYLLGPAVSALVGVFALRGKRRWIYLAAAALICAGLLASGSRAALIALFGSAIAFALCRPWRQAVLAILLIVGMLTVAVSTTHLAGDRTSALIEAARNHRYEVLFSERLVPFLTAIEMIRSRPLTGVGPGCFKYHYMDERLALIGRYPASWTRGWPENFGETHNDHLQVTAETGLPGYALFLAAILLVGKGAGRSPAAVEMGPANRAFARTLRVPLVAAFFIVALAQFPLQIAAPRLMFLSLSAIVLAWDRTDA